MFSRVAVLVVTMLANACGGSGATGVIVSPANLKAARDCDAGLRDACAALGMSRWLHSLATDGDRKASLEPFSSACELGDWLGCAMAATVDAGTGGNADGPAKKAFGLALAACDASHDASACAFLGDWAARAKDTEMAKKHYSRACVLAMASDTRERALHGFVCKRALHLGAAEASLLPARPNLDGQKAAKRISGITDIQPPDREVRKMYRRGVKRSGAQVLLCLSETGVPRRIFFTEFSAYPRWNHKIFETMRDWRYSPMIGVDGTPTPVCTSITFHYLPHQ